MKRCRTLFILSAVFLTGLTAQAQERSNTPRTPAQQSDLERRRLIEALGPLQTAIGDGRLYAARIAVGGAWWTNPGVTSRLGVTDEQKAKLDRAFENHRVRLTQNTEAVTKEETALAKLLEAETIDRNAILLQTDRVIQARADLERENSAMTLEMREALTRAQWMQVPQVNQIRSFSWTANGAAGGPVIVTQRGGLGPGQGAGGRGQRNPAPVPKPQQ